MTTETDCQATWRFVRTWLVGIPLAAVLGMLGCLGRGR